MPAPNRVTIQYSPRQSFLPFHARTQRWGVLVCHRRAGKTVASCNELIKGALLATSPNPLFGYVAPFRSQAKSVAWEFMKRYSEPIVLSVYESDLIIKVKNAGPGKSAELRLFGADNADAMRGLGFDGILMDEYGDFRPSVWGNVIRPTLADKNGWAVFMGTPKGKNQFWEVYDGALNNPDWFVLHLPASKSGILPADELESIRRDPGTTEDQFQQEYECSFEAAILGAFYGVEMRLLSEQGHITQVEYDPRLPTYTAWDLGHRDDLAIWWWQVVRNEIHVIDFFAASGLAPDDAAKIINSKPYHYGKHYLPHDARAKTFASQGKSTIEQLAPLIGGFSMMEIVPNLSVQDGIQATRQMLPNCWFDAIKCKEGIEALRQYEREYDEDKKAFRITPKHNWTSHPADAFRMAAISWTHEKPQEKTFPERALMAGSQNTATMNDLWAAAKRTVKQYRI